MYATCIHCHAPLGANEALERFPVGRRLAIDPAQGRLWVVCRLCGQWNLAPVQERWEAIEEGERAFRDARLRASTDNIGLARLRDGTELIRVGAPLRPEFAAWRYGERFRSRWRVRGPVAAVAGGAAWLTKGWAGYFVFQLAAVPVLAAGALSIAASVVHMRRRVLQLELPDGATVALTQAHVEATRCVRQPDAPGGWELRVRHAPLDGSRRTFSVHDPEAVVRGPDALRAAARLLPRVNRVGGPRRTVERAVHVLEAAGSTDAVFRMAASHDPESRGGRARFGEFDDNGFLNDELASAFVKAGAEIRLAAEMAAHEEEERVALAGELDDLEARWREAEEVARIADDLLLSPAVLERLERLRIR